VGVAGWSVPTKSCNSRRASSRGLPTRSHRLTGLIHVVLILALRNWRVALISFATIPLALFMTFLLLDAVGYTVNTMVLGGLAIALGIVDDDAIIDIENIRRRLHEN
jgi:multidrug efflux pump subunit AcrB